jgi:molecular chaperone DnaJ
VEIPKTLSEEERQYLRKIAEIRKEPVDNSSKGIFSRVKDAFKN